ncbi:MAG: winged helix-turn-helix domain-containing protein [Gammaproteobacteria bacterium]|nr:winged helix-turn-helix domain-containing protein [Gammaproteobacteria bacterium]
MAKAKSEFVKWMGPMLDALRELNGSGKPREVCDLIAQRSDISDKKLEETLKSGQTRFYNQVHWARQYLVWEGLLDGSVRGTWTLTSKGYETKLNEAESRKLFLKWVKIHAEARKSTQEAVPVTTETTDRTGDDHRQVLLEMLKSVTPEGFERLCARLLRESGFEKVEITGRLSFVTHMEPFRFHLNGTRVFFTLLEPLRFHANGATPGGGSVSAEAGFRARTIVRTGYARGFDRGAYPWPTRCSRCTSIATSWCACAREIPTGRWPRPYRSTVEEWVELGMQCRTIHQGLVRQHGFTGSYSSVYRFIQSRE